VLAYHISSQIIKGAEQAWDCACAVKWSLASFIPNRQTLHNTDIAEKKNGAICQTLDTDGFNDSHQAATCLIKRKRL